MPNRYNSSGLQRIIKPLILKRWLIRYRAKRITLLSLKERNDRLTVAAITYVSYLYINS